MPLTSEVKPKYLTLDSKFHFGKYQGCTVQEVIDDDPQYILWVLKKVADVDFPFFVVDMAVQALNKEDPDRDKEIAIRLRWQLEEDG